MSWKKRYWDSYEEFLSETNYDLVCECRYNYGKLMEGMPPEKVRAVARSDDWKKKVGCFKKTKTPVFEETALIGIKTKIELCYWTNFYDNISERFNMINQEMLTMMPYLRC